MIIVEVVGVLILLGIFLLALKAKSGTGRKKPGEDRFRHVGPGKVEARDEHRAAGLD
jgi:hypothetical protein